jgi:hypothetical protein
MIKYTIKLDTRAFDLLERQIKTARKKLISFVNGELSTRLQKRVNETLGTPPAENSQGDYPLKWKSEKQRRFVMAKLRENGNIPYRRTGALTRNWLVGVESSKDSLAITVDNDSPVIDYVASSGDLRQPMFPRWYEYEPILEGLADDIINDVTQYWQTILED